jgi:hypothetical protein
MTPKLLLCPINVLRTSQMRCTVQRPFVFQRKNLGGTVLVTASSVPGLGVVVRAIVSSARSSFVHMQGTDIGFYAPKAMWLAGD